MRREHADTPVHGHGQRHPAQAKRHPPRSLLHRRLKQWGPERAYRTALQRPSKLFDGAVEVAPAIRLGADAGTAVVAAVPCCDSVCGEAAGPDACSDGIWEDPCWGGTRDVP